MKGGSGGDVFIFNADKAEGKDTIKDFNANRDTIRIQNAEFSDLAFSKTGSGVRVDYDGGRIDLEGLKMKAVTEDLFDFA